VDREAVVALLEDHWHPADVAARLGISERTVLRIRHERGLEVGPASPRRRLTEEDHRIIQAALDDGLPFSEISATYGYTFQTLARYYPGRSYSPQEVSALAAAARKANRALRQQRTLIAC
jgi:transposase-like protein